MADVVRVVLEEYGVDRLLPGDVLLCNDTFRVGTHVNDLAFMRPVFRQGRLLAVLSIRAHQLDIGGRNPGGFDITSTRLADDGLVIPPMLVYRAGKPEKAVFGLIAANTRFPDIAIPDLQVLASVLEFGEGMLLQTLDKYGEPAYLGAIRYACDVSAESMRRALERIPDGDYAGHEVLDGDGLPDSPEYVIRVKVKKRAERLEFDFDGTSQASRGSLNCTWSDTKGAVLFALKLLFDRRRPYTSGVQRGIDIVLPPGCILNANPPTATMFYFELISGVCNAIYAALNPALGDDALAPDAWAFSYHSAQGRRADGSPWASLAIGSGSPWVPWSGTRAGDGDSNQMPAYINVMDTGVEPVEVDGSVVVLRRDIVTDTAGAGYNRGGASIVADTLWPHAGVHFGFQSHIRRAPGGINGGRPGLLGGGWLFDPALIGPSRLGIRPASTDPGLYRGSIPFSGLIDPQTGALDPQHGEYAYKRSHIEASAGTTMRFIGNAAGGWGNPYLREPERVLRDVRDEYVSIEAAARDYGVVVVGDPQRDPEGLRLDLDATRALRAGVAGGMTAGADGEARR
jgi:N-methylhydantoinase B